LDVLAIIWHFTRLQSVISKSVFLVKLLTGIRAGVYEGCLVVAA